MSGEKVGQAPRPRRRSAARSRRRGSSVVEAGARGTTAAEPPASCGAAARAKAANHGPAGRDRSGPWSCGPETCRILRAPGRGEVLCALEAVLRRFSASFTTRHSGSPRREGRQVARRLTDDAAGRPATAEGSTTGQPEHAQREDVGTASAASTYSGEADGPTMAPGAERAPKASRPRALARVFSTGAWARPRSRILDRPTRDQEQVSVSRSRGTAPSRAPPRGAGLRATSIGRPGKADRDDSLRRVRPGAAC